MKILQQLGDTVLAEYPDEKIPFVVLIRYNAETGYLEEAHGYKTMDSAERFYNAVAKELANGYRR